MPDLDRPEGEDLGWRGRRVRFSRVPYEIEITDQADEQLRGLEAGERRTVLLAIHERLTHEPAAEARNRKRMRPNPVAPWAPPRREVPRVP
jgi:tRNA (Thr-GGU) A37 N-methylase